MKYSFECEIKTNNDGIRNAVKQLIPSKDDPRVWDEEYECSEAPDIEDGVMAFICMVRFYTKADRNGVLASLNGLEPIVINACESGSFYKGHKCYHDEDSPRPCEPEPESEVRKN